MSNRDCLSDTTKGKFRSLSNRRVLLDKKFMKLARLSNSSFYKTKFRSGTLKVSKGVCLLDTTKGKFKNLSNSQVLLDKKFMKLARLSNSSVL